MLFFFKQKTAYEIRNVTGVQTCALPILYLLHGKFERFSLYAQRGGDGEYVKGG